MVACPSRGINSAKKRNEFLTYTIAQIHFRLIMLSERSETIKKSTNMHRLLSVMVLIQR